ncbi:MAG TPA: TIGR03862 family flavoprotein [Patescibacteria group bacterium]|nr:TIGR03862 family flavoprotein [Patescibacteria group bacterium]
MQAPLSCRLAIIGGGPSGLMAAETARAAGVEVDVYDAMGSVGRKFLIAGKGGLNLTHADDFETFVSRYRGREADVRRWLEVFDADDLRAFARGLGVETFVGSSGRVFPTDLKAAPFLRGWVRRLRAQGVRFHVHHRFAGWTDDGALSFETPPGMTRVRADACILAMGGGSWPELGSDGRWVEALTARGIAIAPLAPSNCGFEADWSETLRTRHAGAPLKRVAAWLDERAEAKAGECVISAYGLEGSLIYAWSAPIRERIARDGHAVLHLNLLPERTADELATALRRDRGKRSMGEHLRRCTGLDAAKSALVFECLPRADWTHPERVAATIKDAVVTLLRPRPIHEAISSAGGVRFDALDGGLMLKSMPGVFCAGEMIDWEAPTGGYLLTACFASGVVAGRAAAAWRAHGAALNLH